jgi:hypothetical protein
LLGINTQYLELRESREKYLSQLNLLQSEKYNEGQRYHYIDPLAFESKLVTSIIQAHSLEGEPQVILYIYVDREFAYKSKVYPKSSNPVINLDIDM